MLELKKKRDELGHADAYIARTADNLTRARGRREVYEAELAKL
jgi:hypothetical protein